MFPFHLYNMGEQSLFIRLQTLPEMSEVGTAGSLEGSRDIVIGYLGSGIPFSNENRFFQESNSHTEVTFFYGEGGNTVKDGRRNHTGIDAHADAILQDSTHLLLLVVGKGDLLGLPDGDHCRVEYHEGKEGMIADSGDDTGLYSRIIFVHPDEGTDHHLKLAVVAKTIGVVQADDENRLAFDEFLCDGVNKKLEMDAGFWCLVPKKSFKNGCKDTAGGIRTITVYEDRHHVVGRLLKFAEYSPDAGGLPGSRRAAKVCIGGACSPQGRTHDSCDLPEFPVAVVDGFRGIL